VTDTTEKPEGKGRPTPKRSEKVAARRKPLVTPRGKAAARSNREQRSEMRRKMREAMRTGEEKYYPAIAAGPERAFVRDVVDARRSYGWLAIPGWFAGLLLSVIPFPPTQLIGSLAFPIVVGILIADSAAAARAVRKGLDAKWPDGTEQSRKSLVWYGIARNTQFRRQRLPRPRVERGATVY
jgi:hypothetical protein